jgi:uncharacterized protein (DUF697 family)
VSLKAAAIQRIWRKCFVTSASAKAEELFNDAVILAEIQNRMLTRIDNMFGGLDQFLDKDQTGQYVVYGQRVRFLAGDNS